MTEIYDVIIIGGGPAGLFAGFYAGMRQMKTKIIDSLDKLGGQPQLLYPDKTIYDIAGLVEITGKALTDNLLQQLKPFAPTICLNEEVISYFKNKEDIFTIKTNKATHYSRSIVIAAGKGAFHHRRLKLPTADDYTESNLHYAIKNPKTFSDKDLVIVGGGDSAVDWALALENIASSITLVHRRTSFRAMEASVELLKKSSINILTPYQPQKIIGDGQHITALVVQEVHGQNVRQLYADEFIVSYGVQTALGKMQDWPVINARQSITVSPKMETSERGVYAIGSIASYASKIDLLATAFGEAPIAINHIVNYLRPEAHTQPIQSTNLHLNHE